MIDCSCFTVAAANSSYEIVLHLAKALQKNMPYSLSIDEYSGFLVDIASCTHTRKRGVRSLKAMHVYGYSCPMHADHCKNKERPRVLSLREIIIGTVQY